MPHLYDKLPPAFAKDPWAWDYTRDRIEGNTGIPYDQWEGKHFAGASAMYKNVVKKYGANVAAGKTTMPRECIDCGATEVHYVDDYVCRNCRDAIESAGSYQEAVQTINQPEAIDQIREQLYKALGHDKKDAKKGRTPVAGAPATPVPDTADDAARIQDTGPKVSRNYKAMGDDKLQRSIAELDRGEGEAVRKIKDGENIMDHYEAALRAAQEKGIAV